MDEKIQVCTENAGWSCRVYTTMTRAEYEQLKNKPKNREYTEVDLIVAIFIVVIISGMFYRIIKTS